MENESSKKPSLGNSKAIMRQGITLSSQELIRRYYIDTERKIPLVLEPAIDGVDLITWSRNNRETIENDLLECGAILFRNFKLGTVTEFEQFVRTISPDLLEYRERSSPRHRVSGLIYTSTDYPSHQSIFLHNENSYAHTWPLKIFFFCVTPATEGGETPIADVRRIFSRISPQVREKFIQKKVLYVRNFTEGLGLSWQTVYQNDDPAVVEALFREAGYEVEWIGRHSLRTRRVGQAVAKHPVSGKMLWFNHATFFHITTFEPRIQKALLEACGEEGLPNNTYYGDGSSIEPETLDQLRDAYNQETVKFLWKQGDILLLDNMSVAHGRSPYTGDRKVVVGMSEAFNCERLSAVGGSNNGAD